MNYLELMIRNPFRNKTRSFLAIVGIAIGIATIVALGVITASLEESTQTTLQEGTAEITAMPLGSSMMGGASGSLNESYVDELKNISGVKQTAGLLQVSITDPTGTGPGAITVYGMNSKDLELEGINSINGSTYNDNKREVIVGKSVVDSENYTIGDNITILGEQYKIVGTYETGSMFTDGAIYTGLETLQNDSNSQNEVSTIAVKVDDNTTVETVNNNIENQYNDTLSTITSDEMEKTTENMMSVVNAATTAIEALAIIIGGVGVINTMMMTVFERTREIGVLKSVGWTSMKVLTMIMGESIVLTIISGIIGTILGLLAVIILFNITGGDMTLTYNIGIFIRAFAVALIVGILGGLYPAIKASRLAPTEALRYE
ncbi:ABC transporter permease [Candidatus Methanosphaera massiliense]|uniref:ABC transporter permease n=1 Tax=Methanosphaera TaxID=2316 RepID=UPI0023808E5D|nr:ABC transporter permease [Candidatus Methanosphaera massiliense]MDD6286349.1 ABC transporter permease [Methanobacteriaceae archaeon]MDE4078392.1 ABC transporter permease [Candidatus Methanosphaera massiliense]